MPLLTNEQVQGLDGAFNNVLTSNGLRYGLSGLFSLGGIINTVLAEGGGGPVLPNVLETLGGNLGSGLVTLQAAGADGNISIAIAPKGTGNIQAIGNILPSVGNTYNLGSQGSPWNDGYANRWHSDNIVNQNITWANAVEAGATTIQGDPIDGAGAIGVILNATRALAASGSLLLSVRNNGVEKFSISRRGDVSSSAGIYAGSANAFGFSGNDNIFLGGAGSGVVVRGSEADGASAVAVIVDNSHTLSVGGAKVLSIRNNGSEISYVDANGNFYANTLNSIQPANGLNFAGSSVMALDSNSSNSTLNIKSSIPNAGGVALRINTQNALSTAGDKIVSFQNNSVEKAFIDKDGKGSFAAGTVIGNMTYNNNQISAGGAVQLFPGVSAQAQIYGNVNPGAGAGTPGILLTAAQAISGTDIIAAFVNGSNSLAIDAQGKRIHSDYIDNSGTPGNTTANAVLGRAAIATAASTCVVSNNRVTATSIVRLQLESDGTGVANIVIDSIGSNTFTVKAINGTGVVTVTTGNTKFSWEVVN